MQSGHYTALLNHGIALALAVAFLTLWTYQRQRRHLAMLAFGYAQTALGFLFQYTTPFSVEFSRLISCIGFMLGSSFIAGAVLARYGRRVPVGVLAGFGGSGVAAFAWFMFVDPDLTARVYAVNFALGAISLVAAADLRPVRRQGPIEMLLFVLSLLSGLNFFVRTIIAVGMDGPYTSYAGFYESAYWTSALLSHAFLAILLALTLFGAAVLDVVKVLITESRTDALSGLLNRRGFADRAAAHFGGPEGRAALALVLADLDHFKTVNDRHGHAAGDAVIAAFAGLLAQHGADNGAVVGRMGGEEFAVLLPRCDLAGARLFAESVRAAYREMDIAGVGPLTCSLGVAERLRGEQIESLMKRTDDALMEAKRDGRDRVRAGRALQDIILPLAVAS